MGEGTKHDQDKSRVELIPPSFVLGIGDILKFGADKYGDRNWEEGIRYSRVYGAALRHLYDWWDGKENDRETGKSHLLHAGCCVMFLHTYSHQSFTYTEFDDRPLVTG